jgi:excisionase family DNA binding protein
MEQSQPRSIPVFAPETNTQLLAALRTMLSSSPDGAALQLVDRDGRAVEISPVMIVALEQLVRIMALGRSAVILPYEQYLSCQSAAELLGVSRPYLYQLLDRGVIPCFKVGSHRRLRFEDVIDYKLNRSSERHQALLELAELSKKLGLFLPEESS